MADESTREIFKIRSSISPELKYSTVKKGGLFGGAGALLILFGGTFLPLDQLKIWGIPLFVVGIFLVSLGLYPYKRLTSLEMRPHELHFDGLDLLFLKQGKPLFTIPKQSIETMEYLKNEKIYGIAIRLKKPIEKKVKVYQSKRLFESFIAKWAEEAREYDLFLPYFSEKSWNELKSYL